MCQQGLRNTKINHNNNKQQQTTNHGNVNCPLPDKEDLNLLHITSKQSKIVVATTCLGQSKCVTLSLLTTRNCIARYPTNQQNIRWPLLHKDSCSHLLQEECNTVTTISGKSSSFHCCPDSAMQIRAFTASANLARL